MFLVAALTSRLQIEWSINPQYSYGWGAMAIAAYLLWKRWESRPTPAPLPSSRTKAAAATFLVACLLPVSLLEEANPDWRLMSWAHAGIVVGIWLLSLLHMGGIGWVNHFRFPILFILIAVPWPTQLEERFVQGLMGLVSQVTVESVNWFGVPAFRRGNVIEVPTGPIGVSEACSGLRSFQCTLMAALFFGELNRFKWGRRVGLVVFGVCLAIGLNILRTSSLVWIYIKHGSAALDRWHDHAGLVVLGLAFFGIGAAAMLLREPATILSPQPAPQGIAPAYLRTGTGIGVIALLLIFQGIVELWFRSGEHTLQLQPLWTVQWPQTGPGFRFNELDEATLAMLRCNEGRSGVWKRPNGSEWTIFLLRWEPGRTAAQLARTHRPEVCLPASGLVQKGAIQFTNLSVGPLSLPFSTSLFDYQGHSLYVFFCVWESQIAKGETPSETGDFSRKARVKAVMDRRRHQGQQILELVIEGPKTQEQALSEAQHGLLELIRLVEPTENPPLR